MPYQPTCMWLLLSHNYFIVIIVVSAVTSCHMKLNLPQALEHSEKAVKLSSSDEAKSDVYHLQGGILKDLGRMEEAEGVSPK